jgi:phosphomannomutase
MNSTSIHENKYDLIIFDLDGTLAESKRPITENMVHILLQMLERTRVAVISGGGWPQFETQFLHGFRTSSRFNKLFLLPTSGTSLYIWRGEWQAQYAENLTPKEKEKIENALHVALKMSGYVRPEKTHGALIEDRKSQITFSALGQHAPVALKAEWDKDHVKRRKIVEILKRKIPEFDIHIGGMTSIDITRRGVNKGYGIRKLEHYLNITSDHILFIGDALFHGGNDYPARSTGADCIQVSGPEETEKIIREMIK